MPKAEAMTVVGLGEVLWDCFPEYRRPGGAPANVAYHVQQLGLRGVICSRVGADELGEKLLAHLREHDLDTSCVQVDREHPTGTVNVTMSSREAPEYTIAEPASWDYLTVGDEWVRVLGGAAAICFGTLAQRSEHNRATFAQVFALAPEAWLFYDVNLRPPFYHADWLDASLRRAQVIKLNEGELLTLDEMLQIGGTTLEGRSRLLCERYDARLVCVTRGAAGCLLSTVDESVSDRPEAVEVVDAVGAGDAFSAGLIYGLLSEWELKRVGSFANGLAGLVASRAGAMPGLGEELDRLLAAHGVRAD